MSIAVFSLGSPERMRVAQAWLKSSMASGDSGGGGGGGGSTAEVMLPSEKAEQDRLDRVKQLTGAVPLLAPGRCCSRRPLLVSAHPMLDPPCGQSGPAPLHAVWRPPGKVVQASRRGPVIQCTLSLLDTRPWGQEVIPRSRTVSGTCALHASEGPPGKVVQASRRGPVM